MRITIGGRWLNVLYCLEEPEGVDRLRPFFWTLPIDPGFLTTTFREQDPGSLCE